MSKKKMTLKDFHGGSIPSDLPLPSAPSVTVKPSDRSSGYERASSWGNRSLPHTSPPTKRFDDKTPFFTHSTHIGRDFDEDERKSLNGVSAPRRTVDDGTVRVPPSRFTAHNNSNTSGERASAWSAPNAVSKLVHASAPDKVASSTWHSKTPHHQPRFEVNNGPRVEVDNGEKDQYDAVLARHAQRGLVIDVNKMHGGGRNESVDSKYTDARNRSFGEFGGSELQHSMPSSEPTERPKLKLLPITKALEGSEPCAPDYVQVHSHADSVEPATDRIGSGKEGGHHPKLNLKPRSQPLQQLEGNIERDRNALFGGARPRELVLKERGIDDVAINNLDAVEHSNRIELTAARAEKLPDHSHQTRYGQRNEGAHNRRTGEKLDRNEQRVDVERVNAHRRNWRSDNWRNVQETDRKQVSERQPSPETWCKPAAGQPKSSVHAVSMSHGKTASALELAQAFSRSVSDAKVNDRFSGQSGLNTSRKQASFSRLVGPAPAPGPHINGY